MSPEMRSELAKRGAANAARSGRRHIFSAEERLRGGQRRAEQIVLRRSGSSGI